MPVLNRVIVHHPMAAGCLVNAGCPVVLLRPEDEQSKAKWEADGQCREAHQLSVSIMNELIIAVGAKDNIAGDILTLGAKWDPGAQVIIVSGKEIRPAIIEKSSALFLETNCVLILVDPDKTVIDDLMPQLHILCERIPVVIYVTSALPDYLKKIGGAVTVMDKDKEARMKRRVLLFLKQYGKKMTDKGFRVLVDKIRDESALESEMMKLVNYVGEKANIDSKDVQAVVTEMHEENMLTLFDAVARMDKDEVLTIFENLLINGVHILAIHSYLVRQIRLLLQAKDMEELYRANPDYGTFAKTFGKWKESLEVKSSERKHYFSYQKPFYAYKLSQASRRIPRHKLIAFLDSLAQFDVRMKRGTRFDQTHMERDLLEA